MDFKETINELERKSFDRKFITVKGSIPVLFSAPHTMIQHFSDGSFKYNEPYTKAISLYMNLMVKSHSFIKIEDTGEDSNRDNRDDFKTELIRYIKENNIKLVIDLHGAKREREFDVVFGTMHNLSADYSTIKELEEAFISNGITNIAHNDPFRGGAITQYLYGLEDLDVIQLEINGRYRDENNLDLLEIFVKSLIDFINEYVKYTNR